MAEGVVAGVKVFISTRLSVGSTLVVGRLSVQEGRGLEHLLDSLLNRQEQNERYDMYLKYTRLQMKPVL